MNFNVDYRLVDSSFEIYRLEDHLELIEKQIGLIRKSEAKALNNYIQKEKLNPGDPEWNISHQNYDHYVEFLLPRILRGPFLVSLYAVFEAAVTEIADLIRC